MRGHELSLGRTLGLVLDHGDDFFESLYRFCADHNQRAINRRWQQWLARRYPGTRWEIIQDRKSVV